jgi:hypothetical protein
MKDTYAHAVRYSQWIISTNLSISPMMLYNVTPQNTGSLKKGIRFLGKSFNHGSKMKLIKTIGNNLIRILGK